MHIDVDTEYVDDAVRHLCEAGVVSLVSLVSHPPSLAELFLRHYGDHPQ